MTRADLCSLTPVPVAELEGDWLFDELDEDAKSHPIVRDSDDVLRFQPDKLTLWLHSQVDLNSLWIAAGVGGIPLPSIARFYREIGYSLSGYHEVIGAAYDENARGYGGDDL